MTSTQESVPLYADCNLAVWLKRCEKMSYVELQRAENGIFVPFSFSSHFLLAPNFWRSEGLRSDSSDAFILNVSSSLRSHRSLLMKHDVFDYGLSNMTSIIMGDCFPILAFYTTIFTRMQYWQDKSVLISQLFPNWSVDQY